MKQASVGFHCPECASGGSQRIIRGPITFDPLATKVLIGLSVLGLVWSLTKGSSITALSGDALIDGGLIATLFQRLPSGAVVATGGVDGGEYYRLVSSAFLHDGLFHIGFNMYALWILGGFLERSLGRSRFVSLYVASMLAGGFGVLLVDPLQITVGASGAVFGLMGAMLLLQQAAGFSIWRTPLLPILGINLLLTFAVPQISIGGHVGGLIGGALVGAAMIFLARRKAPEWAGVAVAAGFSVVMVAAAIWASAQWQDPLF